MLKKLFALVFSLAILGTAFVFSLIIASQKNQSDVYNEYVFVLGAKANGGNLSKTLVNRLDTAFEYLQEHTDSKAILCGGVENAGDKSQGMYMKEYLVKKGISEDRLIPEERSINTFENIKFGLLKLDKKPLNITVISSGYHLFRAKLIAGRFGVNVTTVPAETPRGAILSDYAREIIAVGKSFLYDKPTDVDLRILHEQK